MLLAYVAGGVVLGVVGALPVMLVLRRQDGKGRGMGRALIAFFGSFVIVQGEILVVRYLASDAVLPVGTSAVLTFLALLTACALRAAHASE